MTKSGEQRRRIAVGRGIMVQLISSTAAAHAERERLWQLIQELEIAMLTTVADGGALHGRPMVTQQIDADHAELWFFSSIDSPKVAEIFHERQVGLAYASPENHRYVSVSGRAFVVRDGVKANQLWSDDAAAWFPLGVNDPHLALLRIEVDAAQFWESPSSKVVNLAGLVELRMPGRAQTGGHVGAGHKVNVRG